MRNAISRASVWMMFACAILTQAVSSGAAECGSNAMFVSDREAVAATHRADIVPLGPPQQELPAAERPWLDRMKGSDGAPMALIPAGEFLMGSDDEEIDRFVGIPLRP